MLFSGVLKKTHARKNEAMKAERCNELRTGLSYYFILPNSSFRSRPPLAYFRAACIQSFSANCYNARVSGDRKTGGAKRDAVANEAMAHLDHLYRVAFFLAKNNSDAEDLVQETFTRALAAHEQFDPATNLKAWLTKILRNFFFDHYHQKNRWVSAEDLPQPQCDYLESLPAENLGPERRLLLSELDDQITDVLRRIPEEFRAPIVLVDVSDFSYEEAAAILSCPIGTVRSRLSRGRKLMQKYLTGYVCGEQEQTKRK